MTKRELAKEIGKRVREIRELYYSVYPKGDYFNVVFYKESIKFNNSFYDEDEKYPIDYYKRFDKGEEN